MASASANTFEAAPNELILKAAEELKKNNNIKPPAWAPFVKTGTNREKVPTQENWWYIRAAAVLRQIYMRPQGVQRLRRIYGGRKNMGFKPERFKRGSGNILRKVLQQLEKAGYVKKEKSGRQITPDGIKFLDSLAKNVPAVQKIMQENAAKAPTVIQAPAVAKQQSSQEKAPKETAAQQIPKEPKQKAATPKKDVPKNQ